MSFWSWKILAVEVTQRSNESFDLTQILMALQSTKSKMKVKAISSSSKKVKKVVKIKFKPNLL